VRILVGRHERPLDNAALGERLTGHRRLVIDVGTGGGRAVLATAAAEPNALVVGFDADAASMVDASRRAAASAPRGGRPNALFVVGAAEELPGPFEGLVDEATVRFPWGSLLRGAVGGASPVSAGLARLLRPGGTLVLLVALKPKDSFDDLLPLVDEPALLAERLQTVYAPLGLALDDCRFASSAEVSEAHSSWARRLRVGRDRQAVFVRLIRDT
jgi:16S rRNA (adenine(1408)-N(1))-methyltransferase